MTKYKLYLFGPPRMEDNGETLTINLRKATAILAYLAVTRQGQRRDALATLLWPDKDQRTARANLRRTLYDLGQQLEKSFGTSWIEADEETVMLSPTVTLWTDVAAFQELLAEHTGNEHRGNGHRGNEHTGNNTNVPPTALIDAVALYSDDFLAGFTLPDAPAFDDWQFFQREELRQQLATALTDLVDWYEAQENYEEALHYARRRLQLDPLEEAVHRRLMALYALDGQVAAAVRQYDECTRILHEELDVPPEAETTELFEAIRMRRFPAETGERGGRGDKETRRQEDRETTRPTNEPTGVQSALIESSGHPVIRSSGHPTTAAPRHNLPQQTTPFVGRQQEIEEILRRLSDETCRLLTLIGPGGIGKTRLAIEVARRLAAAQWPQGMGMHADGTDTDAVASVDGATLSFPDGIYLVELQTVQSHSGIMAAAATAIGFRFYSDVPPEEQLIQFLRNKRMLIVLDNLEHLLVEHLLTEENLPARLITGLLAAAPGIKLLATSREALNLQEEWFHPLGGMRFSQAPNKATTANPEEMADAVQLFIQNARRARADFDATADYASIVRICRLVDGVPLALELAAAWLKVLPCPEIANEIEQNLDILTTRHQNIPTRHRSMRAVLEQSWQLLTEEEQLVLQRLSVFRRGCTQEAARAVAGASLLTLAGLTEKALIQVAEGAPGQEETAHNRYLMHELLRQFAAEKLAERGNGGDRTDGEPHTTQRKHSDYYLNKLQQQASALLGVQQQQAIQIIATEIDNLRVALLWAVQASDSGQVTQSLDPLYNFYQIQSRYLEGKEFFVEALAGWRAARASAQTTAHPEMGQRVELQLLACTGALCYLLCDYTAADQYLNEALTLADAGSASVLLSAQERLDATGYVRERAFVLNFLGRLAIWKGEQAHAKALLTESLQLSQRLGDTNRTASGLEKLASLVYATFGDYVESKTLALESLTLSRQLGRPDRIAYALDTLGFVTFCLGEYEDSEVYYQESLTIFERSGDLYGQAMALGGLGLIYWGLGGPALTQATTYFEQSLAICRQLGHHGQVSGRLVGLARVANDQGKYQEAEALAQEALTAVRDLGIPIYLAHGYYCLGEAAYQVGDLETARAHILEALQLTVETGLEAILATILYHYAMLLIKETAQLRDASPDDPRRQEAWRILTLVRDHPATWHVYSARAGQQAELLAGQFSAAMTVPPAVVAGEHPLEATAGAILQGA